MRNSKQRIKKRALSALVACTMLFSSVGVMAAQYNGVSQTIVADQTAQVITSMVPVGSTFVQVNLGGGCGFAFPNFNNGAAFTSVASDVALFVKQNNEWVSIDNNASSGWIYDKNFGNYWDGSGGYWFNPVEETTYVRIASKTNPTIYIDYTLNVKPAVPQVISSMAPAGSTQITVSPAGGCGFEFPKFNGTATFRDVKEDIALFVKQNGDWVSIDNNASSGWIYDRNFGNWWDGPGGYWFNGLRETTYVRVASKTNTNVYVDYTLNVAPPPVRNSYRISNYDGRSSFTANNAGALGLPLPKIDGGPATIDEVDNFVYEVKVDGNWVNILESSATNFMYSANGYNNMSSANQWGYWVDYIFGLWFQPIQVNMDFRIGYPMDGKKGGDINGNYVEYKFIGNPNAPRPDDSNLGSIDIGTSTDSTISGWKLKWNDEFSGDHLDTSKWNYSTGYYLNDDPTTWGWGNNELEHYTDSDKNIFVKDGNLNIVALDDPATFPQDPNRVAPYSSGKITTKDKFTLKYGRVDFRAKLPAVSGAWPALWMLPNDDVYGGWASSGEIDVMEARGRVPGATSGAIHFGGEWPGNKFISGAQNFADGATIDSDFHTYSLVWEPDVISWYVDGKCFYKANKEQWYSAGAKDNPYAPFDQDFYLIMNLALGGWFDGGVEPSLKDFPVTMQVDYVRAYSEDIVITPVTGVTLDKASVKLTTAGQTTKLNATIAPAKATNKNVKWSSSDEKVATVDANGVVKAVENGVTIVTVTTEDGNFVANSTVTVDIPKVYSDDEVFPLRNGKFDHGLMRWSAWSWKDQYNFINSVTVGNNQAVINIPKMDATGSGAQTSAVQFKQGSLQVQKDIEYLLSFDVSSTMNRDVEVILQNSDLVRSFEKRISVSNGTKKFTYSFTATKDEVLELNFLLGKYGEYDAHTVNIGNVVFEMKAPLRSKLKNQNFSNGASPWEAWTSVGATNSIIGGVEQVSIPTLGGEFWSVQFSQLGVAVETGKTYRLVFDMSSTLARKIDTVLESASYDKYLWKTIDINENMNTYMIEFKQEKASDANAKFTFALGAVAGQAPLGQHTVSIDNVYLYEVPDLPADPPVIKNTYLTVNSIGSVFNGEAINISGTSDFDTVNVSLKNGSGVTLYNKDVAVEDKNYTTNYTLPTNATAGTYTVTVTAGNIVKSTTFVVKVKNTTITVNNIANTYNGSKITINGSSNFQKVKIQVVDSKNKVVTTQYVNVVNGKFNTTYTLSKYAIAGTYKVVVSAGNLTVTKTFKVTVKDTYVILDPVSKTKRGHYVTIHGKSDFATVTIVIKNSKNKVIAKKVVRVTNGKYSYRYKISSKAYTGTYKVIVTAGSKSATRSFKVYR